MVSDHPGTGIAFLSLSSGAVVNHEDGDGTEPEFFGLVCWCSSSRSVGWCVLFGDHAFLPGTSGHLGWSEWIALAAAPVTADDVEVWPYSVGILVQWVAFLSSLHWPAAGADLGVGGVSFVEMFILYELWAGERLVLEKAVLRYQRPWRPLSVLAVPLGPGTDIWRSCRFIGAQVTECFVWWYWVGSCLAILVANHCRLRHIGWGEVWSWAHFPDRESLRLKVFWMSCCFFSGTLQGLPLLFLEGALPLRYCVGHAADLVADSGEGVVVVRVEHGAPDVMPGFSDGVDWISGPGGGVIRVRRNRKTPAHLVTCILVIQSRPRVWKRLRVQDHFCGDHADAKARPLHQDDEAYVLVQNRIGVV